jgi:hypothetical protein
VKGDTPLARAAAVLDLSVLRDKNIPLPALAQASTTKVSHFRSLHERLGNYLLNTNKTSTNKSTATDGAKVPSRRRRGGSALDILGIRLAPFVGPDVDSVVKEARDMLEDMERNLRQGNGKVTTYLSSSFLEDIQNHRKVYEAACFYIAVNAAIASSSKPKKRNKALLRQEDDNEDEEMRECTAADILKAMDHEIMESLFRKILKVVVEKQEPIKKSDKKETKVVVSSPTRKKKGRSMTDDGAVTTQRIANKTEELHSIKEYDDMALPILEEEEPKRKRKRPQFGDAFLLWKEQALAKALASMDGDSIQRNDPQMRLNLLDKAATEIIASLPVDDNVTMTVKETIQ